VDWKSILEGKLKGKGGAGSLKQKGVKRVVSVEETGVLEGRKGVVGGATRVF